MNFKDAQEVKKAFEEVYEEIYRTRFRGLPIANHLLSVQVVGLRETEEFYTFCLITPWMLNQVAVPKRADVDERKVEGMRLDYLEKLGSFWVTNVISPMGGFANMKMAVNTAEPLAEQLFSGLSGTDDGQAAHLSRREFLRKMRPKS